jgi:PAS domain S-box-containing protein
MRSGKISTGLFSAELINIGGEPCMISVATDITELKQAEEALANEAIRRRILIEQSRDGIVILDQNGKVYEANRRFAEMLGYSSEEVLQLYVWDWDTQWTREQLLDMLRSVSEAGDHFETYHQRKDGTIYDVEISTNGATFAGQKLVFCVCRDITERKKIEERNQAIIKTALDGFWLSNLEGKLLEVNDSYCKMVGYTREELLEMYIKDIEAIENPEETGQHIKRIMEQGYDRFETQHKCKDGKIIDVEVSVNYLNIGEGQLFVFVRDITGRKRAEQALRESEEKFSKAFRSSPDAIAITTLKDGRFIEVNDSYTRITGYPREEVIGHSTTEFGVWAKAEERDKILRMLKEQGRVQNEEVHLYMKSGEISTGLFSAELINIGGEPCMISVATDITEHKRADEALRESQEFTSSLLEKAPNPIVVIHPDTSIKYVNPAFEELTGFTLAETIGMKTPHPWWPEEAREEMSASLSSALAKGGIRREMIYQKKNGERFCVELNAVSIMQNGVLKYFLVNWFDITENKRAEEALRESEEFSTSLLENAPNPITVINPDTSVRYVNPAFEKLTGFSLAEIAGIEAPYPWWPEDRWQQRTSGLKGFMAGGNKITEQTVLNKSGETLTVELNMVRVMHNGIFKYYLAHWNDITEQRQAEEALKESEEKYRDLLDNTNDLIQSVTPDGHFRYVNNGWRRALGYDENEISNLKVFDILYPDCLQHYVKLFQKMKSGEDIGRINTTFVSKNGNKIIVEGNVTGKFVNGELIYTRGIFRDITQNKYLEEQMFRLSSAVSMSTDCIVITDFDAKVIDVNQKTLEMYGADNKEELLGKHFLELIVPAEREMVNIDVKEIIDKGYLECREYKIISKQGHEFPVQMSTSLVRDADGKPMGMVRVGREIS